MTRMMAAARPEFARVTDRAGIDAAHRQGAVPVLAPAAWLRARDPLPHSWDVTSDSIAAWFAGELQASRLLLVKAAGASGDSLVDRYFARACAPSLQWTAIAVTQLAAHLQAIAPSGR